MKKGNIIRINIDRAKYGLTPTERHYGNILCGTIIKVHKDKVSVKCIDIWGDKQVKYITIEKDEIVETL